MQICIDALQPLHCLHVLGLAHTVLFEASAPAVSHTKEIWRVIVQAHVSNQEVAELECRGSYKQLIGGLPKV